MKKVLIVQKYMRFIDDYPYNEETWLIDESTDIELLREGFKNYEGKFYKYMEGQGFTLVQFEEIKF